MRFLTVLKSGVSIKKVALEFAQILLKESWREQGLCLEIACDFVNDILAAIGLECDVTPAQINAGGCYVWPMEQIHIYNFNYVEVNFKKLEQFLLELCYIIDLQHKVYLQHTTEYDMCNVDSPVDYLMELIAVWCNVYKQLQKMEVLQANKRFEEPLARINFHLLLGMHDLRKLYRSSFILLDAICNRLYWSALRGLFYRQTHDMIFSGLLEIFSQSYELFYASSTQTINFFYEAFAVQINTLTPLKLYQALQGMLVQDVNNDKLNILLNFLIEPNMLQVYFSTFLTKKFKWHHRTTTKNVHKIQEEAIKFFNILQSKLLTLDCFSREFMEAILNLVFTTQSTVATLACNLYITMMKRKFSEHIILKHIMDFYVVHVGTIAYLKTYVLALYRSFEYLLSFRNLLEIISNNQTTETIRLLSAHILVIVFELKVYKEEEEETHHLLRILPDIFEKLYCQKTEGILLQVYSLINITALPNQILDNFIRYAKGILEFTESSLEYPLLMNIFVVFHKCLLANKEWNDLELLTNHLLNKYHEMMKSLKHLEENQQKLISDQSLQKYNGLIKRFNILLKTRYDLLDGSYLDIMRNMSYYFIYNLQIKSVIRENKSLIDVYVLEIITSCMLKLLHQNYTMEMHEATELYNYLWSMLKNLDDLIKCHVVRVKTYFCCFLQLIIQLPLKIDIDVYQQLVQILIAVNFKNKLLNHKGINELHHLHTLQSLEYRRLMLRHFTEMHKYQRIAINTNIIWSLCIYYGRNQQNFQEELKQLLITLADYRLKIYKHILSVLIYNLYKQNPALKNTTIVSILKQHKLLIDNDIKVESTHLLKVHVILLLIQILEKTLSVKRIKKGRNRLEALRHLHIFIEDLNLNELQVKEFILMQANKLSQHLLVADECKILSDFKKLLN